jgi:hypothetical protein
MVDIERYLDVNIPLDGMTCKYDILMIEHTLSALLRHGRCSSTALQRSSLDANIKELAILTA